MHNETEENFAICLIRSVVAGITETLGRGLHVIGVLVHEVTDLGFKYDKHLLRNDCMIISQLISVWQSAENQFDLEFLCNFYGRHATGDSFRLILLIFCSH
jgi:hypothetical protein